MRGCILEAVWRCKCSGWPGCSCWQHRCQSHGPACRTHKTCGVAAKSDSLSGWWLGSHNFVQGTRHTLLPDNDRISRWSQRCTSYVTADASPVSAPKATDGPNGSQQEAPTRRSQCTTTAVTHALQPHRRTPGVLHTSTPAFRHITSAIVQP